MQLESLTFYVSPTGNDAWSGTLADVVSDATDGPFATIARARDAIRTLKAQCSEPAGITVQVRGGWYFLEEPLVFTPEDSGSAAAPICYRAYPGEQPIISGGRVITGWRESTVNGVACWIADLPEVWPFTQLFVNGHRCQRSRLPKDGYYRFTGSPQGEGSMEWDHPCTEAAFAPGHLQADWRNLEDVEIIAPKHWHDSHLYIHSIDEERGLVQFDGGIIGGITAADGQPARYWVEDVSEALSDEGTFYLDRQAKTLTYLHRYFEQIEHSTLIAPYLPYLVQFIGEPLGERVCHVRLEGLEFRHAEQIYPRGYAGPVQGAYTLPGAITFYGAEDCVLYGCTVSQVAQYAIEFRLGCTRNKVIACHLHDLGGGGVKINHDRGFSYMAHMAVEQLLADPERGWVLPEGQERYDTLPAQRVTVSDCTIHDGGKRYPSAIGIWVGDSAGNRLHHNHIFNMNYSGVSLGWNWGFATNTQCRDNLVAYNHIHLLNTNKLLSDMGGIYTLGPQPGTVLRGNHIHDIFCEVYGNWGLYFDQGSSFILCEDNVVYNCDYGALHCNIARDLIVRNNVLIAANGYAINWGTDAGVRLMLAERNLFISPPPQVLGWGSFYGHFTGRNNLYWGPGGEVFPHRMAFADWLAGRFETGGIAANPLLLDYTRGTVALREDSPAYALGFQPLPGDTVGPRDTTHLPASYDAWPQDDDAPRPVVQAVVLIDGVEKSSDAFHGCVYAEAGTPHAGTLRITNRGEIPVLGRMQLVLHPAGVGKLNGETAVSYALQPGEEIITAFTAILTDAAERVLIEAVAVESEMPLPVGVFLYQGMPPTDAEPQQLAPGQPEL